MTEKQIKDHARELVTQEKYQEALDFCNFVLAHNPKNPEAIYTKGHVFMRMDRDEEAIKLFDQALENGISPSGETHFYRGLTLKTIGRDQEGDQAYMAAASNNPRRSNIAFVMTSYVHRKKWSQAIDFCRTVLQHDPKNAEAHFQLGMLFKRLEQNEKAIEYFKLAIQFNRVHVGEAYYYLGMVLEYIQKPREALEAYQSAISHGFDYKGAYHSVNKLRIQLGEDLNR
ncbi:MAG: tetratricopeptide repeat protein [Alphaproteobacteria bacterium]